MLMLMWMQNRTLNLNPYLYLNLKPYLYLYLNQNHVNFQHLPQLWLSVVGQLFAWLLLSFPGIYLSSSFVFLLFLAGLGLAGLGMEC